MNKNNEQIIAITSDKNKYGFFQKALFLIIKPFQIIYFLTLKFIVDIIIDIFKSIHTLIAKNNIDTDIKNSIKDSDIVKLKDNLNHFYEKILKPNKNIIHFLIILFMSFFAFFTSAESATIAFEKGGIIANIFLNLNPSLSQGLLLNRDYIALTDDLKMFDISAIFDLVRIYSKYTALAFISYFTIWFTLIFIADTMILNGKNSKEGFSYNNSTVSRLATFLILTAIVLTPIEVNEYGYTKKITYIERIYDEYTLEKLIVADQVATMNTEQDIISKSAQMINPTNIYFGFESFTKSYLLSLDLDEDVSNIEISLDDNLYLVDFELGGVRNKYSYKSAVSLNDQAENYDINLLDLEKKTVKRYFEINIENAIFVAKKISGIENTIFTSTTESSFQNDKLNYFSSLFSSEEEKIKSVLGFDKDYLEYCDDLDEISLSNYSKNSINDFIKIAALCASRDFVIELYDNDYYDPAKIIAGYGDLNDNNFAIFGTERITNSVDFYKKETQNLCETGGYMACAEALQFLSYIDLEKYSSIGMLYQPFEQMNKLKESYFDVSDSLLKSRKLEVSSVKNRGFKNNINPETSLFSLEIALHKNNYSDLILDDFDRMDFSKLNEIDPIIIFNSIANFDITSMNGRLSTCFYYPNQIKNGYLCGDRQTELLDLSAGKMKLAASIWLSTNAKKAFSTPSRFKGTKIGDSLTNNKILQNSGKILSMVAVPFALNSLTKENNYIDDTTINSIIFMNYVSSFFSDVASEAFGLVAKILAYIAFLISIVIVIFPMIFYLYSLKIVLEIMIFGKIIVLVLVKESYEHGLLAFSKVYEKVVILTVMLGLSIYINKYMPDIIEMIIAIVFDDFVKEFSNFTMSAGIITSFISLAIKLTFSVIIFMVIMNFLTGLLNTLKYKLESINS